MTKYNLNKLNPQIDREVSELTFFAVLEMAQMQERLQPTKEENELAEVLTDMCKGAVKDQATAEDLTTVEDFKRLITSIFIAGRLEGEKCERRKNTMEYFRQCFGV